MYKYAFSATFLLEVQPTKIMERVLLTTRWQRKKNDTDSLDSLVVSPRKNKDYLLMYISLFLGQRKRKNPVSNSACIAGARVKVNNNQDSRHVTKYIHQIINF